MCITRETKKVLEKVRSRSQQFFEVQEQEKKGERNLKKTLIRFEKHRRRLKSKVKELDREEN